jgi:hypothetical protein
VPYAHQRREAGFCLNATLVARENCVGTVHALHKQFTGFPQRRISIFALVKNKNRETKLRESENFFLARESFCTKARIACCSIANHQQRLPGPTKRDRPPQNSKATPKAGAACLRQAGKQRPYQIKSKFKGERAGETPALQIQRRANSRKKAPA